MKQERKMEIDQLFFYFGGSFALFLMSLLYLWGGIAYIRSLPY